MGVRFAIILAASAVLLSVGAAVFTSHSAVILKSFANSIDSANYLQASFGLAGGGGPEWSMLTYSVISNTPQLALTLTYYWYNHTLT